jgi:NADH-quinone oxidoreductase subunit G
VVDICPVGCLLDKDFLFKQRVWTLTSTPSICPGCSTGCAIYVDHNDKGIHRLKPRFNPGVNDWWMCDEGRFGYRYVHDDRRIVHPRLRRGAGRPQLLRWEEVPAVVRVRLEEVVRDAGAGKVAAVLSPFMSCEEAWLLVKFLRGLAPDAALVAGPVPLEGEDQHFPVGASGEDVKFTIRRERCPNRRGVELILKRAGGPTLDLPEFVEKAAGGAFAAAWIVGGYPLPWVTKDLGAVAAKISLTVAQDMFENAFTEKATLVLPACSFAEREGSFVNQEGLVQPFGRALDPPEGAKRDGQYLFEIAGHAGLFGGRRVREMMAEEMEAFRALHEPPPPPRYFH